MTMYEFVKDSVIKKAINRARAHNKTLCMLSCYGDKKPEMRDVVVNPFKAEGEIAVNNKLSPEGHMAVITFDKT